MFFSPIQKFFDRESWPSRRRQPARVRPQLECLEGRMLLSATIYVNAAASPGGNGSAADPYNTIQAGVNAASSGDTVRVAAGTYQEQVTIDGSGKNGIQLVGSGQGSTFIEAPTDMTGLHAIVDVNAAQNVGVTNFTIEGPASGSTSGTLYGIRIEGGGSAAITHNHITQIENNPLSGAQQGYAIDVGLESASSSDTDTGSAIISHNLIDNYQKAGIFVGNAGSNAEIDHNSITGVGPTSLIAQNGVEVLYGATAQVSDNTISGNVYTGTQNASSTGILLYSSGAATVTGNRLSNNDVGLYSYDPSSGPDITSNQITRSTFNGIFLDTTTNATVSNNSTTDNGSGNAGDGGIALYASSNNAIDHNQSRNNNGDGIYVDSASTGNTISQNTLKRNSIYDAQDDSRGSGTAGTANTWQRNHGNTSDPSGLLS